MNLRQVRTKIKSVSNVKKITHALQLVSAIKMRKAQQVEIEGRPYRENLDSVIKKIVPKIDISLSPFLTLREKKVNKNLMIVISSNKGLCGIFRINLERFLIHSVDMKSNEFITVGKKSAVFVNSLGGKIVADYSSNNPFLDISAIFELAVSKYLSGEYDQVSIIYNKFLSTFRSEAVQQMLLPLSMQAIEADTKKTDEPQKSSVEYLIEPSPQELIDPLLRDFIEEKIRGAVISSQAVEHSARMVAMKNATDNASDVIYSLTFLGNKLRQTKITSELLDMITAKESVESE